MRAGSSKISQPASHQQSRRWSYESIKFIIIIIVKMRHKNIRKDDERRRLQAGDDSSPIWVDKLFVLLHKKKEREAFHAIMPRIAVDVWGDQKRARKATKHNHSYVCFSHSSDNSRHAKICWLDSCARERRFIRQSNELWSWYRPKSLLYSS